jgi:hypothetical protein
MLMIIVLTAIAAAGIAGSIVALRNDGLHQVPTDYTRLP